MREDWRPFKVGDLLDLKPGFAFKSRDFKDSGVPIIKIKNVKAGEVQLSTLSYVDPEFVDTHVRYRINIGELLITLSGNRSDGSKEAWVGKVAQFRLPGDFLLNQRVAVLSEKPDADVDMRFMGYLLGSDAFQHLFIAIATSSGGQANRSSAQVLGADLELPPLPEQRAIASILGALDDKIELNRRMNATLESLARAIFKSWFVDFDPVKINAGKINAGQMPASSHDPKVLDLFPSTFQDSDLGPIPEGWERTTLGDEIDFQTGCAFKSKSFTNEPPGIRLARGMNVKEGVFFWGNQSRYWPEVTEDIEQYMLKSGDVLIGMDGSKVGKNWVRVREVDLPCLLVQRVARLRAAQSVGENFLWILCGSRKFRRYVDSVKTGTSIPHISGGQIKSLSFVRPPLGDDRIFHQFEGVVEGFAHQHNLNAAEFASLEKLRDTLLPKLLSGELSIPEVLTATEEALV